MWAVMTYSGTPETTPSVYPDTERRKTRGNSGTLVDKSLPLGLASTAASMGSVTENGTFVPEDR